MEEQGKIHIVTIHFPKLSTEYKPHLDEIGKLVGIVLKRKSTTASRIIKSVEMPSIRVIVQFLSFPKIALPYKGGGLEEQCVIYFVMPNHCYSCNQMGHLAKDCS
jgi:hypothetical protein